MEKINRYGVTLRLIEESDAEFIVNLWENPLVHTFISQIMPTIDSQIKWIQNYKINEQLGLDYYFISQDLYGNPYGTIRLYNFDQHSFELGTWIFMPNSPFGMAVKTHIIGLSTGFEQFKADYCRITVMKGNTRVLRYLDNFKPVKINENDNELFFIILKENFYLFKEKLSFFS